MSLRTAFLTVWNNAYVRIGVLILALVGVLWLLGVTRAVWFTFALAWLVAYLVQPLVNWTERRLRARWLGVVFVLLGFFLLGGLISVLVTNLIREASEFSSTLPALIDRVVQTSQTLPAGIQALPLPAALVTIVDQAYQSLGALLQRLTTGLITGLEGLVKSGGLLGGLRVIVEDVVRFFAFLAMTIYLTLDLPRVARSLLQAVPFAYQPLAHDLAAKLERSVGGYVRGQLLIAAVVGALLWLGLSLIGLPLALSLGVLAGVLSVVPFFGVIGIVPSLLVAASLGWWQVLAVLALFAAANQLESHVLQPLVLGRTAHLHPVTIILALLLGVSLYGLLGAIVAVPIAAFLKLLYTNYYLTSRLFRPKV